MIFTLLVIIISAAILISGRLRADVVGLLVMSTLGISGFVSPSEAVAGFSSSAVVTILSISIIAEGLQQTGIAYRIGQLMKRMAGSSEPRLVFVLTLAGAVMSLFMNNVAALGVLMPAAVALARQTRIAPSRLMMPLSFGVIVGGMATLFTTSNIIASAALRDAGYAPFGVLDFLPMGGPLVLIVIIYMVVVGRRMLPVSFPQTMMTQWQGIRGALMDTYRIDSRLLAVKILPGSPLSGRRIGDCRLRDTLGFNIVAIQRGDELISAPAPDTELHPADTLIGQGDLSTQLLKEHGLEQAALAVQFEQLTDETIALAEVVIPPHSALEGVSLREANFREKFKLSVLSIWRNGAPIYQNLSTLPLRIGDGLLVQGTLTQMRLLRRERDMVLLEEDPDAVHRPNRAQLAALIGLATLVIAIAGWLPVSLAALTGATSMVLAGCLSMDEAYNAVDWKAIFLIVGLWPLSTAITNTGLANALVQQFLALTAAASPLLVIAGLLALTTLLTNVMAGQSAAPIILAPIGISVARASGIDPRATLMTIALGCSLAFSTPIGHPVNVMVMSAGGYRFRDYLRVGGPLTLILFPVILLGLHLFWGI